MGDSKVKLLFIGMATRWTLGDYLGTSVLGNFKVLAFVLPPCLVLMLMHGLVTGCSKPLIVLHLEKRFGRKNEHFYEVDFGIPSADTTISF